MIRCAALSLLGWLATGAGAGAQVVPMRAGEIIRVATADSAAADLWQVGTALAVSWRGVLMRPQASPGDTVRVPLDGSHRVQARRRPQAWVRVGSGIGAVTGTVLGVTALGSAFGDSWGDQGLAGEAIGLGALGALIGAGAGLIGRPTRWEEIGVPDGGFRITPLSRPSPSVAAQWGKTERWRDFEGTEANFAEFFAFWRDSLHPIEGAWELNPIQSTRIRGWRHGRPVPRMAIVRDSRYEGYDYVAVEMPGRGRGARPGYYSHILFALRPLETPGAFDIRHVRGARQGVYRVELLGDWWLEFQFNGATEIEVWDKLATRAR